MPENSQATSTFIDDLKSDLIRDEGIRKSAYHDSRGFLTIGVGRCIDARLNCGLSDDEITYLLKNDIQRVINQCYNKSWYKALDTDNRRRAILNMVFNLGMGHFLDFDNFINLLNKQKFKEAAEDLKNTLWAKQVGERANRIIALIAQG